VTEAKVRTEYPPVVLRARQALDMDEEQFFEFCRLNDELRIERTAGSSRCSASSRRA
jgi:hypothetical protein